jgi:hypothetical protein
MCVYVCEREREERKREREKERRRRKKKRRERQREEREREKEINKELDDLLSQSLSLLEPAAQAMERQRFKTGDSVGGQAKLILSAQHRQHQCPAVRLSQRGGGGVGGPRSL